jgi:hypothetical protein
MRLRRLILGTAFLCLLPGLPKSSLLGQTRPLQEYVLLFSSMVEREPLDESHLKRSQYLLQTQLEREMPSVKFEYRTTLPDSERRQLKSMDDEILEIRLTGDGDTRKAEIGLDSDLHHAKRLLNVVTAEGVSVSQMACNSQNLLKIARKIHEHHDSCHAAGKECNN